MNSSRVGDGGWSRASRRKGAGAIGRLVGLGVAGVAAVTLLGGCSVAEFGGAFGNFGWPDGGLTPQSTRMYDLWIGSVVAALVVGIFVWGLIFWCVIRYRKRGEGLPSQTRYNIPMEFLYTLVPFLIVAVLFYYTAIVQTDVDKTSKNPDLTVEVVAFKWEWQFNYRDAPGADARTVASTTGNASYVPVLVLPTHRTIRIEEHTNDLIHSFWVPGLLFKRDVMPGKRNAFQVTLEKEGAYVGRCAELCGTYHSQMNFELRAVSPDQYDRFIAAKQAGQSTPDALSSVGEEPYAVKTHPFDTDRATREAS
jgi:cytochrome c oxidase subunit 2